MPKYLKRLLIVLCCLLGVLFFVFISKAVIKIGVKMFVRNYLQEDSTLMTEEDRKPLWQRMGEYGLEVLNEKYPGYEFEIHSYEILHPYTKFYVEEKTTRSDVLMHIYINDNGSYEAADNFFRYFMEDECKEYYEAQLYEKEKIVAHVHVNLAAPEGRECDINMTIEDIIDGKAYPWTYISVSASGMTEPECEEFAKVIQTAIEDINIKGLYTVRFFDMTEEEMAMAEKYSGNIYTYIFGLNNGGEEDGR